MPRFPTILVGIIGIIGIALSVLLIKQLIEWTLVKEGFQDIEREDRMTPEAFSYNLLQAVKGPIRRLSSQLINMDNWKERIELAQLSPVELARRYIEKNASQ
jgi:hypothetical protein